MRARRRLICTCGGDIVGLSRAIVNISTALSRGMEVDSRHDWRTRARARTIHETVAVPSTTRQRSCFITFAREAFLIVQLTFRYPLSVPQRATRRARVLISNTDAAADIQILDTRY